MEIFSDLIQCNVGFYGDRCHLPCTNCLSCKQVCSVCKDGYYGDSCNQQCNSGCKTCHISTGSCTECKDGFYVGQCLPCSSGCNTATCRISDGYCECKPRHNQIEGTQCLPCPQNCLKSCNQSLYCDSCKDGYYGENCNQTCSDHCENNKCDRDGRCTCENGYAGYPCKPCPSNCGATGCTDQFKCKNCKTGHHGDYCNKTCSPNCVNKRCDIDASCTCKRGFAGLGCCPENCAEGCNESLTCHSCKSNYYGRFCNETCPSNCLKTCSQIHGDCSERINGYWGSRCSDKCLDNCLNNRCNQKDGTCPCTAGYQGQRCNIGKNMQNNTEMLKLCIIRMYYLEINMRTMYVMYTECPSKTFGYGCNQTCHCSSGSCHHVSGFCYSGCAQDWTGDACQQAVKKGKSFLIKTLTTDKMKSHS